jgi:glutamine phosphoribosylpyrophosphate amidotransferase
MCEHYVARASEAFRLDDLWPFTERLERFGIAGFGWGAAWVADDGTIGSYRNVAAFRDDPERDRIGTTETTAVLVHLRRPSKLSTLGPADTQPFDDPGGRFAFSHNGDLRNVAAWRREYQAQGRIHGRADTEVGQRWLEDEWDSGRPAALLCRLHETMSGQANLAALEPDGSAVVYAGNTENPVFTLRLGTIGVASTGIYSLDRSLFRLVAPEATERRIVRVGSAIALDRHGIAVPAS